MVIHNEGSVENMVINNVNGNCFISGAGCMVINGDNVVVGGGDIRELNDKCEKREYNKELISDDYAKDIRKLNISSCSFGIEITDGDKLSVRIIGTEESTNPIKEEVSYKDGKCSIDILREGLCVSGDVKVIVTIPVTGLDCLNVKNDCGGIEINFYNENLILPKVVATTSNGGINVSLEGKIQNVTLKTDNGSIHAYGNLRAYMYVLASSGTGNISTKFRNVSNLEIDVKSGIGGTEINQKCESDGHNLVMQLKAGVGRIKVR